MERQIIFHKHYFLDFYLEQPEKVQEIIEYVLNARVIFIGYFAVLTKVIWWFCLMDFKRKHKKHLKKKLILH